MVTYGAAMSWWRRHSGGTSATCPLLIATMAAPLGLLPGFGVDPAVMRRTLDAVAATWDWDAQSWGWDYPMLAMTAARLGDPDLAVDLLLKDGPNNAYMPNGHCPQPSADLAVYLPANGALLSAVAMMAKGWDGAPEGPAPGFPRDGSWSVSCGCWPPSWRQPP
ncbi:hypothetical protein ACFL5O_08490 [Myxococcota bacterium]